MENFKIWSRTSEYLSLESITPKPLADLLAYWRRCRATGSVPRQADMAVSAFPDCLSNIALVQLAGDPEQSRYLIVGDALKSLLGENPVGRSLTEVYSEDIAAEVAEALRKVARTREPSFYTREFQILGKSFGYYRLLLPLRVQGDAVERVLVGIYPTTGELRSAKQWRSALEELQDRERTEERMAADWARDV